MRTPLLLLARLSLVLLFASSLTISSGSGAAAQAGSADSVVIVLDVSGSMNNPSGSEPGKSRLDVAKEAVTSAVAGVAPGSINLGLRTFARCGSNLVVPLGPADPAAFNQQVETISAGGSTGIEVALRAAVQDLGQAAGKRTIMLISDGQETCGGDPCAAAAELLAENIAFVVNTVGFQTSGSVAEQQLQCIADVTGGTQTPVENLPELFKVIDQAVNPCSASLIECYAPEVRFHPSESWYPMDPADFIEGAELRWVHSADGFFPRTCQDDETIDDDPNAFLLGQGAYVAQQERHDPSFWNPRRCSNYGKEYTSIEFTRPYQETPGNTSFGNRAVDDGGATLETEEGFTLQWKDYGPWWNRSEQPKGLNNDPGDGGMVTAPMFAQLANDNGQRFIVYHMFYGYDPKSQVDPFDLNPIQFGDQILAHEGDWERIIVMLGANDVPTEVRFEGHGCSDAGFKMNNHVPWTKMIETDTPPTTGGNGQLVNGTHPVVYVAEGSHAAYPYIRGTGPKACDVPGPINSGNADQTKFESGDSVTWRPWEQGLLVDPQTQCWYGFGGAWGRGGSTLSLVGRGDDTGPAGPHWNIDALPPDNGCQTRNIALSTGNDNVGYGDTVTVQLDGYTPGTELVVSLASVEIGMATGTVGAGGGAIITFPIPDGFEPGGHRLIVRAASNGDILAVDQLNILAPPECLIANTGASIATDTDGDNLSNACDLFPTDGPAADFDGDGITNFDDNCPRVPNPAQDRLAGATIGTACDIDNGHNPAAEIYFELTGTYPAGGPAPLPPTAPSAPGAEPIVYTPFDTAPPSPTGAYGFGLNPQAAAQPTEPVEQLPASVPALTDSDSEEIAHTGTETRKLAELGLTLLGTGLLTLAYIRREQDE